MEGDRLLHGPGCPEYLISIHALRVEGDLAEYYHSGRETGFLSTPSGWRATKLANIGDDISNISIHALRVEGDFLLSVHHHAGW